MENFKSKECKSSKGGWKLVELKEICRTLKLPVSGNKAELCKRISDYYNNLENSFGNLSLNNSDKERAENYTNLYRSRKEKFFKELKNNKEISKLDYVRFIAYDGSNDPSNVFTIFDSSDGSGEIDTYMVDIGIKNMSINEFVLTKLKESDLMGYYCSNPSCESELEYKSNKVFYNKNENKVYCDYCIQSS